jgi:hypothetical protein
MNSTNRRRQEGPDNFRGNVSRTLPDLYKHHPTANVPPPIRAPGGTKSVTSPGNPVVMNLADHRPRGRAPRRVIPRAASQWAPPQTPPTTFGETPSDQRQHDVPPRGYAPRGRKRSRSLPTMCPHGLVNEAC